MVVLLFIATVATCILVDYILRGRRAEERSAAPELRTVPVPVPVHAQTGATVRVPEGYYFHPGHTWMAIENSGSVRVGMDDFAQRLAGDFEQLDPPEVGRTVRQGSSIWTLTRNGRKVSMISPVDGVVDEVNPAVLRNHENVHTDPYNEGWIVRIKVAELGRNMRNLLHGPVVQRWIEDAVVGIQNRFNANLGTVMADGGILADDLGALLNDDEWAAICREQFMSETNS